MKLAAVVFGALGTMAVLLAAATDSIPIAIFGGAIFLGAFLVGCTAEIKEALEKLVK